jgi:uncharacterized protein (DUF433 family)
MTALAATQGVPLMATEDGTIRVAGTRISLESILHHYEAGATAEEIALRFPALRLADIHGCLAYYLNHKQTIREYLNEQIAKAENLQQRISADPVQKSGIDHIRRRIQERKGKQRGSS